MQLLKPFLKFLGIFCLSYILLYWILGTGAILDVHRSTFTNVSGSFIKSTLSKASFTIKEGAKGDPATENEIKILFNNKAELERLIEEAKKQAPSQRQLTIESEETSILFVEAVLIPLIFLISLILATPMNWKSKLKALAFGILLMYLFIFFKIWVYMLFIIYKATIGIYEFTSPVSNIISLLGNNLRIGASTIFGTLIWVLVAVRNSRWKELWKLNQ